ncbi:signal peptidase II [Knoellia subterranea]|uniref:Lipoprotein signal peptidase n=1 Tax=Knoellia subterranea KCTC 19937 TaxID=1385521 RepID=A0A0A0JJP4_9MICO|nr:signal peptidase II [Knoellia subterranea]KGN36272.1 signal peptidase [Knoellia subterranea KCTC 19937]
MTRARSGRTTVLLAAVTVAAIDLAAKAASEVRLADSSVDLGLLQLQLAYNSGVAFSMGNALPAAVIVTVTAAIAVALMGYAWHRAPQAGWVERAAGGAVIGGAVANVVDRARDGVVTDYLHTGWWPTFNLADTFLITGFIVIALLHTRPERTTNKPEPMEDHPATHTSHDRHSMTTNLPFAGDRSSAVAAIEHGQSSRGETKKSVDTEETKETGT